MSLFGATWAWLGVLLIFLAPVPDRVMADALSESTFLLFWCWGLWAALRFLRDGRFGWLPVVVGCAVPAYLTRPEGLLLPAGLAATLMLMPLVRAARLETRRWWAAVGFLVIAPLCLVGPFLAVKGGLGTKPAIARVLGLAQRSAPDAADRARPLDPNQTELVTVALAVKGTTGAVREILSTPLLVPVVIGMFACKFFAGRARLQLFLGVLVGGWLLALVRLHMTCGYATAHHAMILGLLFLPAAAPGLAWLIGKLPRMTPAMGRIAVVAVLGLYAAWNGPALWQPLNGECAGYRLAGAWLADPAHAPVEAKVVDLPGWSLFYGERSGYTFYNLLDAAHDPQTRFVVARDAHVVGPWGYCQILRSIIADRAPVASFPARPVRGVSRVQVFDLSQPPPANAGAERAMRTR